MEEFITEEKVAAETTCSECNGKNIVIDSSSPTLLAETCGTCVTFETAWSVREQLGKEAERISMACIPSAFVEALDSPIGYPEVQRWADAVRAGKLRKNLFLHGPPGVGKTHLAVVIIAAFLKQERTAFYLDAMTYLADLRRRHQTHYGDRVREAVVGKIDEIQRRIRYCDLVVIDNCGRGSTVTEFTVDQYSELISRRYETGKSTIFISNHGPSESGSLDKKTLEKKIGEISAQKVLASQVLQIRSRSDQTVGNQQEDFSIIPIRVRNLSPEDSTFLHIWSRLGVFRLLSTRERARLTRPSERNPSEIIEIGQTREFESWGGYNIIQTGAVVDFYDANVLIAILKLYHHRGRNGSVAFTLSELAAALGFKNCGAGGVQRGLKRSLYRLVESKVRIISPKEGEAVWLGGFLNSVSSTGNRTRAKILIYLNEWIVGQYGRSLYSVLSIPSLVGLRSLYAQGMYRFLVGQRDGYKFIGLTKWRMILGVSGTTSEKEVRRNLRAAIVEMIERGLLDAQSHLDDGDVVHTYLLRSAPEATN